ncbi:aldo/keto reductase [Paenibacillus senegalensis]|uniref:aldo/keto reductase n=1 Tax=Paenibacillus senegalensis TaxID=1465766 RepID=UPI00028836F8|nr:aldo/keto reductase [Paenibacillus senegalensis]
MDWQKPDPKLYHLPFHLSDFNGMPYRSLGASGLKVPNIGLGTWKIGFPETGDGSRVNPEAAFAIFDRAIELGVTFWDTANRYNAASGNSERIIGQWLSNNQDQRRNVIIATKLFGGMDGRTPNHCGLSRGNILDSVHASLKRMQLEYIDLLYFHGYDLWTPIEESLAAIEDLVRQGYIRYFAVSNFTVDQIKAYQAAAKHFSIRCHITAVQNQYDILFGERNQAGVLERAVSSGFSFVPWSPIAKGLLSDRYLDSQKLKAGDRLYDENDLEAVHNPLIHKKLTQLAALAHDWNMELSQLAIAYMLTLPGMGPIIVSSSNVEQLESNAKAGKLQLNDQQQQAVKQIISM